MRAPAFLRRLELALADTVFPENAVCLGCGRVSRGQPLCGPCREELNALRLSDGRAVWLYRGVPGRLVREAKERGIAAAAEVLSEGIAEQARGLELPADTVVTWVPMPVRRRLDRGIDHGRMLAEAVAGRLGLTARAVLRRKKGSSQKTQRGLSREERLQNVRDAFELGKAPVPACVLLVDDVVTTGATGTACRETLLRGGAERVYVLAACAARAENRDEMGESDAGLDADRAAAGSAAGLLDGGGRGAGAEYQ